MIFDIIHQVQGNDLAQEEMRVKAEREQRRLLRLQAGGGQSINELLAKLTGSEEKADDTGSNVEEAPNVSKPVQGGFPAPPTSGSGTPR